MFYYPVLIYFSLNILFSLECTTSCYE